MIPVTGNALHDLDFVQLEMPSRTYFFDIEAQRIRGSTDRLEAMRQAIYLMIYTERYQYPIYSWGYGAEMDDLIGQPIPFILPEVKRRVSAVLLHDDRITAVDDWTFDVRRGMVKTTFTAHTIYGDINADVEVNV